MALFTKKLESVLSELESEKSRRRPISKTILAIEKTLNKLKSHISEICSNVDFDNLSGKRIVDSLLNFSTNIIDKQEKVIESVSVQGKEEGVLICIKNCLLLLATDTRYKTKLYRRMKSEHINLYKLSIFNSLWILNKHINKHKESNTNYKVLFIKEVILESLLKLSMKINDLIICYEESIKNKVPMDKGISNELSLLKEELMYNRQIISSLGSVLIPGSLENDKRFLEILESTITKFENYENEDFLKLSVQIGLSKKYVEDILKMKKMFLLSEILKK